MTTRERLLKKKKSDLQNLLLLYASEDEDVESLKGSKAKLVDGILLRQPLNSSLIRRIMGWDGVSMLSQLSCDLSSESVEMTECDDTLTQLFIRLEQLGLASHHRNRWQVDPWVWSLTEDITDDVREQLRRDFDDGLMLESILSRYGMLTIDKLQKFTADLKHELSKERVEELLIIFFNLGEVIWTNPNNPHELWATSRALKNPQALYDRLQLPSIKALKYAPCLPSEVLGSNPGLGHVSERIKLMKLLPASLGDRQDLLDDLQSYSIGFQENMMDNQMFGWILREMEKAGVAVTDDLIQALDEVRRNMPLWYNKGWSMARLQQSLTPEFDDANDEKIVADKKLN